MCPCIRKLFLYLLRLFSLFLWLVFHLLCRLLQCLFFVQYLPSPLPVVRECLRHLLQFLIYLLLFSSLCRPSLSAFFASLHSLLTLCVPCASITFSLLPASLLPSLPVAPCNLFFLLFLAHCLPLFLTLLTLDDASSSQLLLFPALCACFFQSSVLGLPPVLLSVPLAFAALCPGLWHLYLWPSLALAPYLVVWAVLLASWAALPVCSAAPCASPAVHPASVDLPLPPASSLLCVCSSWASFPLRVFSSFLSWIRPSCFLFSRFSSQALSSGSSSSP